VEIEVNKMYLRN